MSSLKEFGDTSLARLHRKYSTMLGEYETCQQECEEQEAAYNKVKDYNIIQPLNMVCNGDLNSSDYGRFTNSESLFSYCIYN